MQFQKAWSVLCKSEAIYLALLLGVGVQRVKTCPEVRCVDADFSHVGTGRHIPLCMAGACVGIAKPGAFLRRGGSSGSGLGTALSLAAVMVS